MAIRIFVAFDVEHDQDQCAELLAIADGQAQFQVSGTSKRRSNPDAWARSTLVEVAASDQVVVLCGAATDSSVSVAAELRMAREAEKPVILLWSRRDQMCTKPVGARPTDVMYSWTPEILQDQLAANRRNALKRPLPSRLVRRDPDRT